MLAKNIRQKMWPKMLAKKIPKKFNKKVDPEVDKNLGPLQELGGSHSDPNF